MTGEYQKDFEDIDALKREVRKKIGPNNPLLKKLDAIYEKDRLMEQQNPAMTTLDMITRQEKLINDIQRLLNEVYKELKNKLTPQDFELLERSQKRWTKNVDDYISQAFPENENLGSSAPIQKGACTENLTSFRAYLLILILKHVTQGS
jgi:RNAse (barnase) inhibitor barstar